MYEIRLEFHHHAITRIDMSITKIMVGKESPLLFLIVTVLVSRNRTRRDPRPPPLDENPLTVFEEVDIPEEYWSSDKGFTEGVDESMAETGSDMKYKSEFGRVCGSFLYCYEADSVSVCWSYKYETFYFEKQGKWRLKQQQTGVPAMNLSSTICKQTSGVQHKHLPVKFSAGYYVLKCPIRVLSLNWRMDNRFISRTFTKKSVQYQRSSVHTYSKNFKRCNFDIFAKSYISKEDIFCNDTRSVYDSLRFFTNIYTLLLNNISNNFYSLYFKILSVYFLKFLLFIIFAFFCIPNVILTNNEIRRYDTGITRKSTKFVLSCIESTTTVDVHFLSKTDVIGKDSEQWLCERYSDFICPQEIITYPLIYSLNQYLINIGRNGLSRGSREEEMCHEVRRFQLFNNARVKASPMRLARSGFFPTGSGDETRCFSCGVTHRNWQLMDKVDQVHRSLSPGCLHLNGGDPRNVPISSDSSENERVVGVLEEYPQEQGTETPSGVTTSLQSNHSAVATTADSSRSSSTTLDISNAVYPQFKDLQSRLESYQEWSHSHVQDPKILAAAGFYYAGYRDCVRCFYCGVGLRTWEKEDDPWVMHVRWRSSCDYIRAMKGEQFVVQALTGNTSASSASTSASISRSTSSSTATSTATSTTGTSDRQSQDSRSEAGTPALQAEEMGFPRDQIDRAMSELTGSLLLSRPGQPHVDLETLLEKLILMTTADQSVSDIEQRPPRTAANTESSATSTNMSSRTSENSSTSSHHLATSAELPSENITRPKEMLSERRDTDTMERGASEQTRVLSLDEERQLEEENQSLREESTCKICMDNPSCIVFLPCGHLVTCAECAPALRRCPICRALIRGSVRVHTVSRQHQQ